MTRIIGLLGAAGSGKSTVAKHLINKYGAKQYTLAAPLKVIVGRAFSLTDEQLYGTQEQKETVDPRYNVSPRWLFQRIGTEGIRSAFGDDVWWKLLLDKVKQDNPQVAVCDDVRFINEAQGLKDAGAYIIRLESVYKSKADATHASEAEWSKAPYNVEIKNDGVNMERLLSDVDSVLRAKGITPTNLLG